MKEILLFTDGSVNVQTKTGFGAYLILNDFETPVSELKELVELVRFENTSSTKLEIQTLLQALKQLGNEPEKVTVYTDSQNIVGLSGRREKLEKNNFISKKNERLKNYELYQEFYRITDVLNCEFIKVRGHQQTRQKDLIHKIFTLVDRASRSALRAKNTSP